MRRSARSWLGLAVVTLAWVVAPRARAFVGFSASSARPALHTAATTVVVLREGDRSVVTVRPSYHGPAADFAWVLPVPPDVDAADVRALRVDALERIEAHSAPALSELWERDPCAAPRDAAARGGASRRTTTPGARLDARGPELTVLAAPEPDALLRWLAERGYRAPEGAGAAARPYIARGWRFLIAEHRARDLSFTGTRAALPPLRFATSADLSLPLRFAGVGAQPSEAVVVLVLAPERHLAAGRPNVFSPSDLSVTPRTREQLDPVHATVLARLWARHPDAVITEHARRNLRCPECGAAPLDEEDLRALGQALLGSSRPAEGWWLTRLRLQLGDEAEDLRLAPASPRRRRRRPEGFRTRYRLLHAWDGPVACAAPTRERWGAPPRRARPAPLVARLTTDTITTGQLRRYLLTFPPVLRIPSRGDAHPAEDGE